MFAGLREEQGAKHGGGKPAPEAFRESVSRKNEGKAKQKQTDEGGLWTGKHKSGITMEKAKEKLHIGKHKS